jgi:hypothetical protein
MIARFARNPSFASPLMRLGTFSRKGRRFGYLPLCNLAPNA